MSEALTILIIVGGAVVLGVGAGCVAAYLKQRSADDHEYDWDV